MELEAHAAGPCSRQWQASMLGGAHRAGGDGWHVTSNQITAHLGRDDVQDLVDCHHRRQGHIKQFLDQAAARRASAAI